jgi:hypothetical protein
MVSYEYLEKAVEQLHTLEQKSDRFATAIQKFCEGSFVIVNTSYFSFAAELIEKLLAGDTEDDTFTYWLYECNEQYGETEVTNSDGTIKTYKLNSLRDVYNYYTQECWGKE